MKIILLLVAGPCVFVCVSVFIYLFSYFNITSV